MDKPTDAVNKPDTKPKPLAEMTGAEILALAESEDKAFYERRKTEKKSHLARQSYLKKLAPVVPERE